MGKPPSRTKYEAGHPVLSARVSKETRDLFDELRRGAGVTWDEFLFGLLAANGDLANENEELKERLKREVDQARAEGHAKGLEKGLGKFEVPCAGCGKPMAFDARAEAETRAVLRRAFRNYYHETCA